MSNTIITGLVIAIIIFALYLFIFNYFRKSISKKAIAAINSKNSAELDRILASKSANFFLKPFELFRFKLINAASKGSEKEIKNRYYDFDKLRMNKTEKENIYSDAYLYFMSKQDKESATKYYNLSQEIGDYKNKYYIQCSYNTFIEKGDKFLEDTLTRFNATDGPAKASLASLISAMYANRGDKASADKYEQIAKRNLADQFSK